MKERPIIFSAPMVRALLDGSKSQTRRVVKPLPIILNRETNSLEVDDRNIANGRFAKQVACPYGQPGDRLWVRETFQYRGASYDGHGIEDSEWFRCYGVDGAADNWDPDYPHGWYPTHHMNVKKLDAAGEQEDEGVTGWVTRRIPSIHMPRWASRITLEVTAVRVERLQDISEADAMAEGIDKESLASYKRAGVDRPAGFAYREIWESINGPYSWDATPWVWVIEFRRPE